jgi:UDP-N-acetylmuramate-alanine ligase
VDAAASVAQEGDMILTLGAGNVSQFGPLVLEKLKQQESAQVQG